MHAILSSFALIAVTEFGDKTQLLAFALASRFRKPWAIMGGILVATILNHSLATWLGLWVSSHVPERTLGVALCVLFFGFAAWTLKADTLDAGPRESRWGAFATTTVLFFFAEIGDKTQFAAMALAARFHSALLVTLGSTAGMLVTDGLAVFLGEKLSLKEAQLRWVRWAAAALFVVFGLASLANGLRGE